MKDEINLDMTDADPRDVQINQVERNANNNTNNTKDNQPQPPQADKKEDIKQSIIQGAFQSAAVETSDNIFQKVSIGFDFLKKYFDLDSADFFKRLLQAFVPFNPMFYKSIELTPDLWGPVWIYTTLIFIIAACGSISKYLSNDVINISFFQEFIPIAAAFIYGLGFILPLVLFILMKIFGTASSYVTIVCIYGYSMGIYLPIIIACTVPIGVVQWILLAYAVFSSTSILLVSYWKELSKYVKWQKYVALGIVLGCQVALFCALKFYFFAHFNSQVTANPSQANADGINTNSTMTNSTVTP